MKTAFGWVSKFGVLYRAGRAPMVAVLVAALLLLPALAMAKGPVVSAPSSISLWDSIINAGITAAIVLLGPRNLS